MVQSAKSAALSEPKTVVGEDAVIFGELLSHGAQMAIGVCKA